VKTYDVIAHRDGGWWSVEIPGVNGGIWTQGRTLAEAEMMAHDAIALTLDVPGDAVAVALRVGDLDDALARVREAREARAAAAAAEQATLTEVARKLTERGISQRDAARILGLSHQRVSQLLAA
jgi:predicted RNase H-like HicB family nuclease